MHGHVGALVDVVLLRFLPFVASPRASAVLCWGLCSNPASGGMLLGDQARVAHGRVRVFVEVVLLRFLPFIKKLA